MSSEHQTCPRRTGELGPWSRNTGEDKWRTDRDGTRTCSFCGSLHPEDFFKAIKEGCELGPTDKNYKVYVDLVEPHPDELRVVSVINWDPDPERIKREGWKKPDKALLERDGWSYGDGVKWMQLSRRGPRKFGKFYFQHLTPEQQQEFVKLLNDKQLKIGYPGFFYRLPYFVRMGKPSEPTATQG